MKDEAVINTYKHTWFCLTNLLFYCYSRWAKSLKENVAFRKQVGASVLQAGNPHRPRLEASRGGSSGSLKVGDADKRYTGGPKERERPC